ncbi:MAG: hypothetical protein KGZ67_04710, partial [Hydrogenophaga sp.]|nr:hypothetical protein [Hydrogenophaga sp.]
MPEPISPAAATIAAATPAVTVITALGVPLGLRPDVLVAGFAGALVAVVLLNSVPSTGDTWEHLLRTTLRRMAVVLASSLTAGYLTPMVMLINAFPDALMLGAAFAIGGGAQRVLLAVVHRI